MTQFWMSDRPRILVFRKTSPSPSYFTLASGGYIIRIRPTAIGIDVVPTENPVKLFTTPGARLPTATPKAMARKIHSVR